MSRIASWPNGMPPSVLLQPAVPQTWAEKFTARAQARVVEAVISVTQPPPPLPPKTVRPATQSPRLLLVGVSRQSQLAR